MDIVELEKHEARKLIARLMMHTLHGNPTPSQNMRSRYGKITLISEYSHIHRHVTEQWIKDFQNGSPRFVDALRLTVEANLDNAPYWLFDEDDQPDNHDLVDAYVEIGKPKGPYMMYSITSGAHNYRSHQTSIDRIEEVLDHVDMICATPPPPLPILQGRLNEILITATQLYPDYDRQWLGETIFSLVHTGRYEDGEDLDLEETELFDLDDGGQFEKTIPSFVLTGGAK